MSRVLIVLVNWNGWRDTVECLESLLHLDYDKYRIALCDNGSTDGSVKQIRNWAGRRRVGFAEYGRLEGEQGGDRADDPVLTLIRSGENLGFAGGNNVGLRYGVARGDFAYFWLLNNDTVVEPDALASLVARMQSDEAAGICGSTIAYYEDRRRVQALGGGLYCRWAGLPWHYGRFTLLDAVTPELQRRAEARMNYVEGASMLVSAKFLAEIGLMCEDYFLFFEEADWAARAAGRFTIAYAPQSVVYHKVGRSIGTSSHPTGKSFTCDYYNIRNRILFTRRYCPVWLPTVYLVLLGELVLRILLGRPDRGAMILRLMLCNTGGRPDLEGRCRSEAGP